MEVIPFKKEHFEIFSPRPREIDSFPPGFNLEMGLANLAEKGVGGCVVHDGRIIGIIGWLQLSVDTYEIWAFPSTYIDRYAMMYLRSCRRYIRILEQVQEPKRLQTTSYADDIHDKWMEFLGFSREKDLPGYYADNSDARLWSKTY